MPEQILILDFGSQYTQLIARRIRELNIYCQIFPFNHYPTITPDVKGIILSGSPCSVRDEDAPDVDLGVFGNLPVLGICYGAQLMAQKTGGSVTPSKIREYGRARLSSVLNSDPLLAGISTGEQVWMSHGDTITALAPEYEITASTDSVNVAAYRKRNTNCYGIQFHPEVTHTIPGQKLLQNFAVSICGCRQDWTPGQFIENTVHKLKEQLGSDKVVMALSGGVDSTVAAVLVHKAIGQSLSCIFVDNGLLRKDEFNQVLASYRGMGLNIKGVDSKQRFYAALKGLTEPEAKRKAIGKTFIEVFDEEAHLISGVSWLGQGTIYPDVIESVSVRSFCNDKIAPQCGWTARAHET